MAVLGSAAPNRPDCQAHPQRRWNAAAGDAQVKRRVAVTCGSARRGLRSNTTPPSFTAIWSSCDSLLSTGVSSSLNFVQPLRNVPVTLFTG